MYALGLTTLKDIQGNNSSLLANFFQYYANDYKLCYQAIGLLIIYFLIRPNPYFGCVVGRVGNRISGGKFNLDGVEYQLAKNDGENSIHGGTPRS